MTNETENDDQALVPLPLYPNLRPYVKGDTRINRAGRPKHKSLRSLIQEVKTGRKKKVIAKVFDLAEAGDVRAAEFLGRYGEDPASLEVHTRDFTIILAPPREEEEDY